MEASVAPDLTQSASLFACGDGSRRTRRAGTCAAGGVTDDTPGEPVTKNTHELVREVSRAPRGSRVTLVSDGQGTMGQATTSEPASGQLKLAGAADWQGVKPWRQTDAARPMLEKPEGAVNEEQQGARSPVYTHFMPIAVVQAKTPKGATWIELARTPQPAPAPSTPGSEGKCPHGPSGKFIVHRPEFYDESHLPVSLFHLREKAANFPGLPSIFRRSKAIEARSNVQESDMSDCASEMDDRHHITVPGWHGDPTYRKPDETSAHSCETPTTQKVAEVGVRQSVHKVARQKGVSSGRTYTSKYRGVHQTFPTRRWEAQFRRNGKPTSLGCFDHEEEAARAYDKMMVLCELHGQDSRGGTKGGGHKLVFTTLPLNFDFCEYESDFEGLRQITQDDLVQNLRRQGRMQAATNNAGGGH